MNDRDIDIVTCPDVLPFRPLTAEDEILQVVPGLLETLIEDGWHHGFPPHVTQETQLTDLRLCREMQCGHCHTTGLACWPLHKGGRYKVVAMCDHCGTEEEI
jgi:hypothetical protein